MTGKHGITGLSPGWLVVVGLALAALFIYVGTSLAAPKQVTSAKPGSCTACHGEEKVFSPSHVDTKDMAYKDCLGCHEKAGPQKLQGKLPASHLHQLRGITCEKCHGKAKKPEEVNDRQCLTCHNADKLAERTATVRPENPHTSPHYGTTLDCNLCHHQHAKSENFCSQCHDYKFMVP